MLPEIWFIVKSFLLHKIGRHGAHLRQDKEHVNYNAAIKSIPAQRKIKFFCIEKNNIYREFEINVFTQKVHVMYSNQHG